ncbi:hypothetical protein EV421DRAFT_2025080 [Armillaria borealis]|uniref:Uncharacterized protein n=1 Tax=Armillaria borealis TaxID=47425 RepID=A0AA39IVW0_9AGAR|nr:hypothetical protein EV421DRAFT_2025080 [Armillaria borealis]
MPIANNLGLMLHLFSMPSLHFLWDHHSTPGFDVPMSLKPKTERVHCRVNGAFSRFFFQRAAQASITVQDGSFSHPLGTRIEEYAYDDAKYHIMKALFSATFYLSNRIKMLFLHALYFASHVNTIHVETTMFLSRVAKSKIKLPAAPSDGSSLRFLPSVDDNEDEEKTYLDLRPGSLIVLCKFGRWILMHRRTVGLLALAFRVSDIGPLASLATLGYSPSQYPGYAKWGRMTYTNDPRAVS